MQVELEIVSFNYEVVHFGALSSSVQAFLYRQEAFSVLQKQVWLASEEIHHFSVKRIVY